MGGPARGVIVLLNPIPAAPGDLRPPRETAGPAESEADTLAPKTKVPRRVENHHPENGAEISAELKSPLRICRPLPFFRGDSAVPAKGRDVSAE